LGDRSENADYQAAKEKLRFIDKRLFYLNNMIEKSHIIDPSLHDHTKVSFGSSVVVLDLDNNQEVTFTLCGVTESEPENGLISIHSPIAKALLGKELGDQVRVKLPNGYKEYEIEDIYYKNIFSIKKNIKKQNEFTFH